MFHTKHMEGFPPWLTRGRLFWLFLGIACVVFGQLYNAGFVTDFLGWLECRESTPLFLSYTCFGNRGLYFFSFIILEFLTGFFALHPLPWFVVWTGLHAINAWLVTMLCIRLCTAFKVSCPWIVPVLSGLVFLLHPWQVEVIAWKACANYLGSCMFMLLATGYYLRYRLKQGRKYYWFSTLCYVGFLYSLEFALVYPLVIALLGWSLDVNSTFPKRVRTVVLDLLPFLAALAIWFISNKLAFGQWIGHYGQEAHTTVQLLPMFSTVLKYLIKTAFFLRFLDFNLQTKIYGVIDSVWVSAVFILLIVALVIFVITRIDRMSSKSRLSMFLFLAGVILLVPVSNLYFYYLQYSENDRYSYLALAFLSMLIPGLIWHLRGTIGKLVVSGYLIGCLLGTIVLVRIWEKSTKAYWEQIRTFPEPQSSRIFLLNIPDNYKGTFMFRNIGGNSAFEEVYHNIAHSTYQGEMYDVFQYNMTALENDFIVTRESPTRLKVEFAQWGNWWWRNGIGADRYHNDLYTAWPEGKYYVIEFKEPPENADILYYTPGGWKRVE